MNDFGWRALLGGLGYKLAISGEYMANIIEDGRLRRCPHLRIEIWGTQIGGQTWLRRHNPIGLAFCIST